jgi:hypothetical protein
VEEVTTELWDTGDFRISLVGMPAGMELEDLSEDNLGLWEGIRFERLSALVVGIANTSRGCENLELWNLRVAKTELNRIREEPNFLPWNEKRDRG